MLAVLSFEEQIKIDLSTDIMVGPHGAGLMHNIFMRDRAALVEVRYLYIYMYVRMIVYLTYVRSRIIYTVVMYVCMYV